MSNFAFPFMQTFLSLSKEAQYELLTQLGEIIINSRQGYMTTEIYKLKGFFVKVTENDNGTKKIEALPDLDNLQLNEINPQACLDD
ncbi:MAG: hypothetical protein INR73_18000 [Williamsia sp.]|nr:hypothetical protein [Williamsia sp.]